MIYLEFDSVSLNVDKLNLKYRYLLRIAKNFELNQTSLTYTIDM